MNSFEKKVIKEILKTVEQDLAAYTPSLALQVHFKGQKKAEILMGKEYKYYDLASLTKPLFTVSTFMRYCDEGRVRPDNKIYKILPWWQHKRTEVQEVLSHHAGLAWWAPFFEMLDKNQSTIQKREHIRLFFEKLKLGSKKKCVYSDLDFILLGFIAEAAEEKSLLEIFENTKSQLQIEALHFCPENKPQFKRSLYAPTEKCPWRKKVLQGEVHDDNTWAMGGVSTHAGLFGDLQSVADWGLLLRKALLGLSSPNIKGQLCSTSTARLFCKRQVPRSVGDWAMGLMMPGLKESTAGKFFSKKSVGHTGFTGTSIWYDPDVDLLVTLLSNRVHPTRENIKFRSLRPLIHDIVYRELN